MGEIHQCYKSLRTFSRILADLGSSQNYLSNGVLLYGEDVIITIMV